MARATDSLHKIKLSFMRLEMIYRMEGREYINKEDCKVPNDRVGLRRRLVYIDRDFSLFSLGINCSFCSFWNGRYSMFSSCFLFALSSPFSSYYG